MRTVLTTAPGSGTTLDHRRTAISQQRPRPRRVASVVGLVVALVAGSTGIAHAAQVAGRAGAGDRIDVVAAFYPLAEVARQIGGNAVSVQNLTPAGVEPHDLELTTDQVDAILDAKLAIVMGKGFQPAVESAAKQRDGATLSVLSALTAVDAKGKHVAKGKVAASSHDPHVWLDPVLMRDVVAQVERALAKADPSHARQFAANACRYEAQIAHLDADYRTGLATCQRKLIVTSHAAFGYLAKEYGLRQAAITGISPDAEADPQRLSDLTDLVERNGVTTIFTETLVSPKVAQTLAREAGGVHTAVLNPLEGLTDAETKRGDDYLSVMRANLAKLRAALGCT